MIVTVCSFMSNGGCEIKVFKNDENDKRNLLTSYKKK